MMQVQSRAFPSWMTVFVNAGAGPYDIVMEDFPDKYNTTVRRNFNTEGFIVSSCGLT
jgi:hypothetical protein